MRWKLFDYAMIAVAVGFGVFFLSILAIILLGEIGR